MADNTCSRTARESTGTSRLSRRAALAGLGASLVAAPAAAEVACGGFNVQGIQQCTAGVRINGGVTARQACHSWCWAACAEAIFRIHGFDVPQEAVVQRLYGQLICTTATGQGIYQSVAGPWRDRRGRQFNVQPHVLLDRHAGIWNHDAVALAAQELAAGRPLINGAMGHATAMTAMTYVRDQWGRGQPLQIIVRDPWPGNQNRRELSMQEAWGTFFLMALHISG